MAAANIVNLPSPFYAQGYDNRVLRDLARGAGQSSRVPELLSILLAMRSQDSDRSLRELELQLRGEESVASRDLAQQSFALQKTLAEGQVKQNETMTDFMLRGSPYEQNKTRMDRAMARAVTQTERASAREEAGRTQQAAIAQRGGERADALLIPAMKILEEANADGWITKANAGKVHSGVDQWAQQGEEQTKLAAKSGASPGELTAIIGHYGGKIRGISAMMNGLIAADPRNEANFGDFVADIRKKESTLDDLEAKLSTQDLAAQFAHDDARAGGLESYGRELESMGVNLLAQPGDVGSIRSALAAQEMPAFKLSEPNMGVVYMADILRSLEQGFRPPKPAVTPSTSTAPSHQPFVGHYTVDEPISGGIERMEHLLSGGASQDTRTPNDRLLAQLDASAGAGADAPTINVQRPDGGVIPMRREQLTPEIVADLKRRGWTIPGF
jgi:hypothetical protein